jgi:hypothetical protein
LGFTWSLNILPVWQQSSFFLTENLYTTFSNISVISWQSVSLVKETGMAAHASAVHADDL